MNLPLPAAGTESPDLALAAAFAAALEGLHRDARGEESDAAAVNLAAQRVCLAIQQGQASLDLDEPAQADLDRAALRRSPVVADLAAGDDSFAPLVLQGARLSLHRYWAYERRLAQGLRALNRPRANVDATALAAQLAALFPDAAAPDWQRLAAATAVSRGLCVISGGPGTGKTTTVVRVLAALLALEPSLRIAIAAPTGKAAARLQESIRQQLATLDLPEAIRSQVPTQAQTVHRLLGVQPDRVQPRHHAGRVLPYAVVVVDEASMLDLALAAKLVDALPAGARLILLGDKDQLAAVEAGAVYAAVSARRHFSAGWRHALQTLAGMTMPATEPDAGAPLADAVVWLERSYRFAADSGIGRLAGAVRRGEASAVLAQLQDGGADLRWTPTLPEPARLAAKLAEGFEPYLAAVRAHEEPAAVLRALERYRVLCATRTGRHGSQALGPLIAQELARRLGAGSPAPRWFAGRAVIVSGNDYGLRLYNGDIGVLLPDAEGRLLAWFPASEGGVRALAPARLGAVESAFALTVHKSQGSEFESADLVIDPQVVRGLTRELVYTGLTRVRRQVGLWCEPQVLADAVSRRLARGVSFLDD